MSATGLIARCRNRLEPTGVRCDGRLTYHWGQVEAPCDACGAQCGIAVADWVEVAHIHGAWCHPSADGCPDRPGM